MTNHDLDPLLKTVLRSDGDVLAKAANFCAFVNEQYDEINWVGFYRVVDGRLLVGPFQGLPAVDVIEWGAGVCGAAASQKKTIVVNEVCNFPGHIVCDPRSQSEIVIPVMVKGDLWAVLDIDSPVPSRFTPQDQQQLEAWVSIFIDESFA